MDITTGKIEKTETMDYQGKIDGMLEVMRQIVLIFAGKQPPKDKDYYTNRSNYINRMNKRGY